MKNTSSTKQTKQATTSKSNLKGTKMETQTLPATKNTKAIANKLQTRTEIKALIKQYQADNKIGLVEIIKLMNTELNELQESDKLYAKLTKKQLAKIVKSRYDSKDGIINTVLNFRMNGLTINPKASQSMLNKIISYLNSGEITKSQINKNISDLEKMGKILKVVTDKKLKAKWGK